MKHYIITIFAMLALSVGSASCSEDEPLQGTGQQTTPNNGNNNSGNNNNNNDTLKFDFLLFLLFIFLPLLIYFFN